MNKKYLLLCIPVLVIIGGGVLFAQEPLVESPDSPRPEEVIGQSEGFRVDIFNRLAQEQSVIIAKRTQARERIEASRSATEEAILQGEAGTSVDNALSRFNFQIFTQTVAIGILGILLVIFGTWWIFYGILLILVIWLIMTLINKVRSYRNDY